MIFKKSFFNIEPQKTENEIEIGSGFGGGPWLFKGEKMRQNPRADKPARAG